MTRFFLTAIVFLLLIAGSCSGEEEKPKNQDLIPQKELVNILADIYVADGLLTLPQVSAEYSGLDSVALYDHIIELNGYSKQDLDNTIRYYVIRKPKKLIEIYDQVLAILSERESIISREASLLKEKEKTLWPGEKFYSFPDPQAIDSLDFEVKMAVPGNYYLKYTVTLFADDQTLNPRAAIFSVHIDSVLTGKRRYLPTLKYLKDGHSHTYQHVINVGILTPQAIKGSLYSFDNNPDDWGKHAVIDSVSLIYLK
jgi:hypothetical protein